jgi:hypothetical protein
MDRESFVRRFANLAQSDDTYGLRNTSGLTDDGIAAAEQELHGTFPPDFVWFLKNFWTGLFDSVDLYTFQRGDRSDIRNRQPEGATDKFIAFSDDGFGNAYCFPVEGGRCVDRVVIVPILASEYTGETIEGGFLDFVAARA